MPLLPALLLSVCMIIMLKNITCCGEQYTAEQLSRYISWLEPWKRRILSLCDNPPWTQRHNATHMYMAGDHIQMGFSVSIFKPTNITRQLLYCSGRQDYRYKTAALNWAKTKSQSTKLGKIATDSSEWCSWLLAKTLISYGWSCGHRGRRMW